MKKLILYTVYNIQNSILVKNKAKLDYLNI